MMNQFAKKFLKQVADGGFAPDVYTISGISTTPEVIISGKKVLMFGSNNYLGLAGDERIKESMIQAVKKYGMGSGGSRLVSGNLDIHRDLEIAISSFKQAEDAIIFSTGYMANTGVIPSVVNPIDFSVTGSIKKFFSFGKRNVIFSDELNHASIVDGVRLSKARREIYRHKDLEDLENKLRRTSFGQGLIVTDGVFSMDGDIAPLPKLIELAQKFNALLMVDDAHATGVIGKDGGGTMNYFGIKSGVDIMMGTFTKAFGAVGGFVCGTKDLIDYLRFTSRPYIFSAPIPPSVTAGIIKSIEIVKAEPERRFKLIDNANFLKKELKNIGLDYLNSETQIIPVLIGDEKKTKLASHLLFDEGIFAPLVMWPAVPWGQARLRVTVMATHTHEHLEKFLGAMENVYQKIK